MIIKDLIVHVYDVEVFPNVLHVTVKNTELSVLYKFEISKRKNELTKLVEFFKDNSILFCGYNNHHYDDVIINYIIDYYDLLLTKEYTDICLSIYNLSKTITTNKDDTSLWSKWKYLRCFKTMDLLTMLYSQKLRVGLKELQVTMLYHNVQEYDGDFSKDLPLSEIDKMIVYNINDVNSTETLLNRCKKDIELRLSIEQRYGIDCLSKDGMTLGMSILKYKYMERTGISWDVLKTLRSPMDYIPLKDVILPFITFKSKTLKNVLADMKNQTVSPGRKGYENKFIFNGLRYSVGVGGIHSINSPEIIIPKEDELLIDADVASLYPSLLLNYDFYPKHLGIEFKEIFQDIVTERLAAKHAKQVLEDTTLKLAINGLSGNLQNMYSFVYSPLAVMQIRINGQLLLLMLIEQLSELGCKIIQANTDGVFILMKKDKYNDYKEICRKWEELTQLKLEDDQFEEFYQYAINDYIAVKSGYSKTKDKKLIKEKGMFITKVMLGKGMSAKIIPEAIQRYLVDNIPIEDTIYNCTDINKFITYQKVSRKFKVEYNNNFVSRINRYYASINGCYLYRCEVRTEELKIPQVLLSFIDGRTLVVDAKDTMFLGKYYMDKDVVNITPYTDRIVPKETRHNYTNLLTASGVTILNTFDDIPITERNINYGYYLKEARKIINELKPQQLTLW